MQKARKLAVCPLSSEFLSFLSFPEFPPIVCILISACSVRICNHLTASFTGLLRVEKFWNVTASTTSTSPEGASSGIRMFT